MEDNGNQHHDGHKNLPSQANPPQSKSSPFLRPREAAEYLSVSPRTLSTYMKTGKIPYSQIARAVFIRISDLDAAVARHTQSGGQADE